jgi:3-keto-disaccharide hydrolase
MLALLAACSRQGDIREFQDGFDRSALGADWSDTGVGFRIVSGELVAAKAYNHPLWLAPRLPRDAEISFDARSQSPDGDIKVEAWGDGESAATTKGAYTATGYVLIFGGWKNRLTVLARLNEHGADRKARADMKVEPGRTYHWRIVRKGERLSWWIDGQPVFEWVDPDPLFGAGHDHFGFCDWEAELHFDNLHVRAL